MRWRCLIVLNWRYSFVYIPRWIGWNYRSCEEACLLLYERIHLLDCRLESCISSSRAKFSNFHPICVLYREQIQSGFSPVRIWSISRDRSSLLDFRENRDRVKTEFPISAVCFVSLPTARRVGDLCAPHGSNMYMYNRPTLTTLKKCLLATFSLSLSDRERAAWTKVKIEIENITDFTDSFIYECLFLTRV